MPWEPLSPRQSVHKLTVSLQDQAQVDTLIPLLALRLDSVQGAIIRASEIVNESIQRFEMAEKDLLQRYSKDSKTKEDISKFIDGAKYACTANLNWRYVFPSIFSPGSKSSLPASTKVLLGDITS